MNKYQLSVLACEAERVYFRDYRFAEGRRRSMLDMECDIKADLIADEIEGLNEVQIGGSWLEHMMPGSFNKKTGHFYQTFPREGSLNRRLLLEFLDNKGFLHDLIMAPHDGAYQIAENIQKKQGYKFSDPELMRGRFRNVYSGAVLVPNGVLETAIFIVMQRDETIFRVRIFEVFYRCRDGDTPYALWERVRGLEFDRAAVRDCFASFGTNSGMLYGGYNGAENRVNDISFNKKGTRALAMTLHKTVPRRLQLRRLARDVQRFQNLLYAIEADLSPPLVA